MGSKNLKAVAVRGHQKPKVANEDKLRELRQWVMNNRRAWHILHKYGTGAWTDTSLATGNLPVRNFRDGLLANAMNIDAKTLLQKYGVGMDSCFGCPVRCKKRIEIKEGPYRVDPSYGGPEYETLAALGSNCGITDVAAVSMGNQLCGAYSLDTISTGGSIAFAMECYEKELLTKKDAGGLELRFGNAEAMLKAIELIGHREGIGKLLAEGTMRMSREIGKGSRDFAMQVKGLEAGMHEPRLKPGLGLGYMVNSTGADHCLNMHDTMYTGAVKRLQWFGIYQPLSNDIDARKVAMLRNIQFHQVLLDSLGICLLLPYDDEQRIVATAAVTGWNTGAIEQFKVAERILTTMRLFNMREGFTAQGDALPNRFFQPKTDGYLSDKALSIEKMEKAKRYYYLLMGWNEMTGVPLPEKLEELGIPS